MEPDLIDYHPPKDLLSGRVILVTGAAQGIGRTAALAFAAHGATVVLHDVKVALLEEVYDEIETAGGPQPTIFPLDLVTAGESEYNGMASAIYKQLTRLDGILHNAAYLPQLSPLENETLDQWAQSLRANLIAPFALTKACLPLLKVSPDASVVMTSDHHGSQPTAYWGCFAIAKGGVEHLVKMWAQELDITPQIRINAVVPGPVQSPQRRRTHPGELYETLPPMTSLMSTYLYLMGSDSRGVSGKVLNINATS